VEAERLTVRDLRARVVERRRQRAGGRHHRHPGPPPVPARLRHLRRLLPGPVGNVPDSRGPDDQRGGSGGRNDTHGCDRRTAARQ
jgi:hypothetical protein